MRGFLWAGMVSALLAVMIFGIPANAQVTGVTSKPPAIETLVEQARDDGYQVILVPPGGAGVAETVAGGTDIMSITARIETRAQSARDRLVVILSGLDAFPAQLMAVIERHGKTSGAYWPALALALVAVFLMIGWGVERVVDRWLHSHFQYASSATSADRAGKISYLLLRAVMRALTVFCQLAVAGILTVGFGPDTPAWPTASVTISRLRALSLRMAPAVQRGSAPSDEPSTSGA